MHLYTIIEMKEKIKQRIREGLLTERRVKHSMPIPEDIITIKNIFKKNGYKLYIVGGAVRDTLQGKPIKDYDLATDAFPDDVEKIMQAANFKTLGTGKNFGVINVFTKDDEYEIATFREDVGYTDGRRPDAVKFSNIETDVKRRDLTINALFYDIDSGEIVDLVGGIDDIKNGVVRTVGAPKDRFGEDRLRILRAIRFAGRYGSKLDPEVDAELTSDSNLKGVSPERIRDEFIKTIKSAQSVKYVIELYRKYGLMNDIFDGLDVSNNYIDEKDYIILIAFLLRINPVEKIKKQLNILTYSVDEIRAISFLIGLMNLTVENAPILKKNQGVSKVTSSQIKRFCELAFEGDKNLIDAFIKYNLSVSGEYVINKFNLKGVDIGNKILSLEIDKFKELL